MSLFLSAFLSMTVMMLSSLQTAVHSVCLYNDGGKRGWLGVAAMELSDGSMVEQVDLVVMATGWQSDWSILPPLLLEEIVDEAGITATTALVQ